MSDVVICTLCGEKLFKDDLFVFCDMCVCPFCGGKDCFITATNAVILR